MKLGWLIGGGALAALFLGMPACGSDDTGATSGDAGNTVPEGGLADVTPTPLDSGTDDAGDASDDVYVAPPACNDGKVDLGETCDPLSTCPTDCPPVGCQLRALDNGGTCTAICDNTAVQTTCLNGDGCCPTSCSAKNDSDCTATCGNGIVEQGETCDGNCPTSCTNVGCETRTVQIDNMNPCTAHCVDAQKPISQCNATADQCCPSGCNVANDPDCGLGVCGNGTVDNGETCDPGLNSPKPCPTSCAPQNGCSIQTLQNPGTCMASCQSSTITTCSNKDGCCAAGCNALNDSDCTAVCGNGVVEPGEDCDGNCPTSCPSQGCQEYTLVNNGACKITCKKGDVQTSCINNDQCCPAQCTGMNDTDCAGTTPSQCGDGVVEPPETCDGNCVACNTPKACFKDTGAAKTCNLTCDVPIETCSGSTFDGCCPYAMTMGTNGTTTCGADTDADCVGKSWQSTTSSTVTVKAGACATFVVGNITANASYDFTTCIPANATNNSTGNPHITDATQPRGETVPQSSGGVGTGLTTTYPIANENCTDPSSLPLLAGWTCKNMGGVANEACGSADSGGFIVTYSTPVTVQVCAGPDNDATFPFTVFYNTVAVPTITQTQ